MRHAVDSVREVAEAIEVCAHFYGLGRCKGLLTRNEGRGRGGGRGGRRRGGGKSEEKYAWTFTYIDIVVNMLQGMATSH